MAKTQELKTYSLQDADIDLITYALRRLRDASAFATTANDCKELLEYIERLKRENQ